MNNELLRTRSNLNRFLMGRAVQTCNAFELEHFDVDELQDLLVVHDGTKPPATLPDVYERQGDVLRLVEWWNTNPKHERN